MNYGKIHWSNEPLSPYVELSDDLGTARLKGNHSGSVLVNRSFNSGKHAICFYIVRAAERGCRYIGVVNERSISLDSNLQYGGAGHRVAWDGSCAKIYYDINTYRSFNCSEWTTGDYVHVVVDCDNNTISFWKNEKFERSVTVEKKNKTENTTWTPVLGFGETMSQTVSICSYTSNFTYEDDKVVDQDQEDTKEY
jgi:hypothetical protein